MSDESYRKWLRAQVADAIDNINESHPSDEVADRLIERFFIVPRHTGVGK